MKAGDDEEALRWEGDVEPSAVPETKAADVAPVSPAEPTVSEPAKPGTSSFLLITYGIIAGAFLIYTLGWVAVLVGPRPASSDILGEVAYWFNVGLAIASPAIWFGAAFLLTRGRKSIVRLLALLLGLVVVLPWPFVILGAS
jgi:hypothetical protein